MRRLLLLLAAVVATTALASPLSAAASEASGSVVVTPVSFPVLNINRSGVPCQTDGLPHNIVGSLVRPANLALSEVTAATVYLHGSSGGAYIWQFPVEGYDFAVQMARRGHVSVVVDRLGYGDSSRPVHGYLSCWGGEADIIGQVIDQLRAGDSYLADGGKGPKFTRIAVAGHSAGGVVAHTLAYSFPDKIDALVTSAYATSGETARARELSGSIPRQCLVGEPDARRVGPVDGYYRMPFTASDFFFEPDQRVVAAWQPRLAPDPCGLPASSLAAVPVEQHRLREVTKPVLLLFGAEEAIYEADAATEQRDRFTGSADVTLVLISRAGHTFFLDGRGAAARTHAALSEWLSARGF